MSLEEKKKEERDNILFITLIVALLAFFFSLGFLLHTQVPLAVVSSWSMEPTLHVGDLVVVMGQADYSPGDIVVYSNGPSLIVHRIVKKLGDGSFVTKGDANMYADAIHPKLTQIKGKVVLVVPYFGSLKLMFEKMIGR